MFSWYYDADMNFPVLTTELDIPDGVRHTPRPVFYEELDYYKVYEHYDYPKSDAPLMWATNNRYIYHGETMFRVRGDGSVDYKVSHAELRPINMAEYIARNKEAIDLLTADTKRYIVDVIHRYPSALRVATYSGGKDSSALLDLVYQVAHENGYEFHIIFVDSTLELDPTYEFINQTFSQYSDDDLIRTHITKPYKTILELWKVAGPPSRNARWCCHVAKSQSSTQLLRKLGKGRLTLMFEGVRKTESVKRSKFEKEVVSYKHAKTIHIRPLFDWLTLEVYAYHFVRGIPLNPAYRFGLARVGCGICPYSPPRENKMKGAIFSQYEKFQEILKEFADKLFEEEEHKIAYIEGDWRGRKGGNPVIPNEALVYHKEKTKVDAYLINPTTDFNEWVKVVDPNIYDNLVVEQKENKLHVKADTQGKGSAMLEAVLWKSAHCAHCGACASHCPTGALAVYPEVHVNTDLCVHCHECLTFYQRGCVVAASLGYTGKAKVRENTGSAWNKYGTFIPTLHAIEQVASNPNWMMDYQDEAINHMYLARWMYDMGIAEPNFQLTELAEKIAEHGINEAKEEIYNNLMERSKIMNWMLTHDPEKDLDELAKEMDWGLFEQVRKAIRVYKESELYQWLIGGAKHGNEGDTSDN